MRCMTIAALCLLVAGCGEAPPTAQHESRALDAPGASTPGAPTAIPDQGTVTKTLGGPTVTPPEQGRGTGPGDMDITAAIRRAIIADATLSVRAKEVTVSTSNGKVILRGTVASDGERSRIEILARDSSGSGAAIDNRLDVEAQR
jgi:hypothetical protein